MLKRHSQKLEINQVWFSRWDESIINIKRRNDGNIYEIKKDEFLKTKLGKIIGHYFYVFYLEGVPIKFNDELIVKLKENQFGKENRSVKIKDFICDLELAKEIIYSNAKEFNDKVDKKFKKHSQDFKWSALERMTFFKFIDSLQLDDIIISLQNAIDDHALISKYINLSNSTIRRDREEGCYYEDDYEEEYDYNNIADFNKDKNNFLDNYKNKHFLSWPISRDWIYYFITNFWTYGYNKNFNIKLVPFTEDKDVLSKLNDPNYIYVFCKTTDFTETEKKLLLKTFYENQSKIKLFTTSYLKKNNPNIFKRLSWW